MESIDSFRIETNSSNIDFSRAISGGDGSGGDGRRFDCIFQLVHVVFWFFDVFAFSFFEIQFSFIYSIFYNNSIDSAYRNYNILIDFVSSKTSVVGAKGDSREITNMKFCKVGLFVVDRSGPYFWLTDYSIMAVSHENRSFIQSVSQSKNRKKTCCENAFPVIQHRVVRRAWLVGAARSRQQRQQSRCRWLRSHAWLSTSEVLLPFVIDLFFCCCFSLFLTLFFKKTIRSWSFEIYLGSGFYLVLVTQSLSTFTLFYLWFSHHARLF